MNHITFLLVTCWLFNNLPSAILLARCPNFEKFSRCDSNDCQPNCTNLQPEPNCDSSCNPGCICMDGYLRDEDGSCIPSVECNFCHKNERYSSCAAYECANTCQKPNVNYGCKPPACRKGCVCQGDMVRNEMGNCVDVKDCKVKCADPNAISTPCGDPYPETCIRNSTRKYSNACVVNGCSCKPGYVIGVRGWCMPKHECSTYDLPKCGENEVYDMCPPFVTSETYCDFFGREIEVKFYPESWPLCQPSCRCCDGFVRDPEGKCVPLDRCCVDPNARYVPCPNPCDGGTCQKIEFDACDDNCLEFGCQCKDGFVKEDQSEDAICVPIDECKEVEKMRTIEPFVTLLS